MNKLKNLLGDLALTIGACIGVGVASGTEPMLFVGNNLLTFAITFVALALPLRAFCAKHGLETVEPLADLCFGRAGFAVSLALAACNALCISAMTACAADCLDLLFGIGKPIYAIGLCATAAFLAGAKTSTLKTANGIGTALCLIWLIVAANADRSAATTGTVDRSATVIYAAFCVTMTASLHAKSAQTSTTQGSGLTLFCGAAALCGIFVLAERAATGTTSFATLSDQATLGTRLLAGVTIFVTTSSGIACNLLPIASLTQTLIPEKPLRLSCILSVTTALSLVGAAKLMRYGYTVAGVLGFALVAAIIGRSAILDACKPLHI